MVDQQLTNRAEVRAMGRRASAKARAERAAKRAALVMPTVRDRRPASLACAELLGY